jgi:hypothetical protein
MRIVISPFDIDMCHVPDVQIHKDVQLYHATAALRYAPLRTHNFRSNSTIISSTSTPVSALYPCYPSGYMVPH